MMTQGDSIYDIIDKRDHQSVQTQLLQTNYSGDDKDERTFFCRMNVSRSFRRQSGFGDHKVCFMMSFTITCTLCTSGTFVNEHSKSLLYTSTKPYPHNSRKHFIKRMK